MNSQFLIYLLQASICQMFFYGVYVLFLRKETFFNLNRTYLLFSIVLSLLIPIIKIKREIPIEVASVISHPVQAFIIPVQSTTQNLSNNVESSINISIPSVLLVIYFIGLTLLFAKFTYQFFRLMMFVKKGSISINNRHYMICTEGQYPTSSFFKYILWDNTISLSEKEIDQIIKHEMTHIDQLHTLDNLLMEMIETVFWFNPVAYLYNKELKAIHEYVADNAVITNAEITNDDYEVLINKQILNNIGFQLSNNFNMSNLKTRIAMMTKPKSGKSATLKLLFAFPVASLMMFFFSLNQISLNAQNDAKHPITKVVEKQDNDDHPIRDEHGIHITIAGVQEGTMAAQKLLEAGEIKIVDNFIIKHFSMGFLNIKNQTIVEYSSDSGVFTPSMREWIKNSKSGQKIIVSDIYYSSNSPSGGELRKISGRITITIE